MFAVGILLFYSSVTAAALFLILNTVGVRISTQANETNKSNVNQFEAWNLVFTLVSTEKKIVDSR